MGPILSTSAWSTYIRRAMNLIAAALRDPADLVEISTIIRLLQEIDRVQRMIPATTLIDAEVQAEFLYRRRLTQAALSEQLKSALQDPLLFLLFAFGFFDFSDQTLGQIATYLESCGAFLSSWIELVGGLAPPHLKSFPDVMQQFLLELGGEEGQRPLVEALALFLEARHSIEDTSL